MHPPHRVIRPDLAALLLLAGAAAGLPAAAQAQSCSVSAEPMLFDPYDPIGAKPSDGIGTVRIRCDGPAAVSVGLGSGNGGTQPSMSNGIHALGYGLYADPSRLIPWGDGAFAPARSASGPEADLTVYGRIPPGQNVSGGSYTDVIVIQLSF